MLLLFNFINQLTLMKRGYFAKEVHALLLQIIKAISYNALIFRDTQAIRPMVLEAFSYLDMQNCDSGG